MLLKHLCRRDAVLVLFGAACFYTFSAVSVLNAGPESHEQIVTEPPATQTVSPVLKQAVPVDLGLVQDFPETSVVAHAPGWTIFRNLYMSSGSLLLVTRDPSQFPEHRMMTSTGLPGNLTNDAQRIPTPKEMAFVTPEEAKRRWGCIFVLFVLTFPLDFHFVAELMFGSTAKPPAASTDPSFNPPLLPTSVPTINRAIFIHSDVDGWRDGPGFNGYFMRAVFPSMTIEVATDWIDRVNATANTEIGRAWHFPLVLLTDRSAAFRGAICGAYTQRTAAEAWTVMAKAGKIDLIGNWWAGGPHEDENLPSVLQVPDTVVITYINRQGTRRHLRDEDNRALIAAVEELVARKNRQGGKRWEFNNVHAEQISLDEQIQFAAKTTCMSSLPTCWRLLITCTIQIMLGVHGNGLTHLVFMKPTRVSAVVEMFIPGGFARDYEWTTRSLGMTHYSVWNNESFTHPHEPVLPDYPDGFHGPNIPLDGPFVARLIEQHVAMKEKGVPSVDNSPVHDQH
ncbi:hypothetical protein B0H14DRAFT_2665448 [Mycena olivaceomarginata]|nr:hypothetical protein B0H14DRAFT_2665448 [Mycena olivaceomarginata]